MGKSSTTHPQHYMTSRADYLSKYLSQDNSKKDKKKKHKNDIARASSRVIIEGRGIFQKDASSESRTLDKGKIIKDIDSDLTDEYQPTKVEGRQSSKSRGGFRRIDNGEIVKNEKLSPADFSSQTRPATVYRDSSGRIIDLQAKRAEVSARKQEEIEREKLENERVNMGDSDRFKQVQEVERLAGATRFDYSRTDKEYEDYMTRKSRFDDPFSEHLKSSLPAPARPLSGTGRPNFEGGPQPANRFKILAGHFWDGIDRGNGFEDRVVRARELQHVKKVSDRATKESYTEYDFD